jgi:hypothetical protein
MQNENYTGETRCWVFGSSRPLLPQEPLVEKRLKPFFSQWNAHGLPVSGRWRILYDRFLVILREPEGAEVSGCSIDSMVSEIKLLETEMKTSLLDSSRIFFRNQAGLIEAVTRLEFKNLAMAGEINPETEVFDTTLTRLSDMEVGVFTKPMHASWHYRIYEQAKKQVTV